MLLRRSGEKEEKTYDLSLITSAGDGRIGVEHETFLLELAEAVVCGDVDDLAGIRQRGGSVLGEQGLVDAIGVACGFNGITRIANATGLPLDAPTAQATVSLRQETGIDDYSDARKSHLFS